MRHIPAWLAVLMAGASVVAAGSAARADTATGTASAAAGPATASGGGRLYVPEADPGAYRQAGELTRKGQRRDAQGILAMAKTPQAVWFGDRSPDDVESGIRTVMRDAARKKAVPTLVLYNVPGRDCAQYSAGGAAGSAEYRAWIDAAARGLGSGRALVVLEPDSLALLPDDCGRDDGKGALTAARYAEINYAVDALEPLAGTQVYLDTGHPAWYSVRAIVPRLIKAGVTRATGFFTNVSYYGSEAADDWYGKLISSCIAYAGQGGAAADCPDQYTPHGEARAWLDGKVHTPASRMSHFVTDTSRNGRGVWTVPGGTYADAQDWCNPPGRGLGARPTLHTGDPLEDARLWIKNPGESDGPCLRGTQGPQDPERGMLDPAAGDWFPEMALELVRGASPPVLPRT